jgi:uncharacterized membrane protein YccC
MSNSRETPSRWRWRAQVARMIADAAHEIATQRQMLAIADAYERCAEWAEHRSLPPMLSLTSAETYSAPAGSGPNHD